MGRKIVIALCVSMTVMSGSSPTASVQEMTKPLTVWLIPLEPAARDDGTLDLDKFNAEVGADGHVTVLNTTVPVYQDQLRAWNPEFASPNFPLINGQRKTLAALQRFARERNIRINVRFVWWLQAFQELNESIQSAQSKTPDDFQIAPDVAQIGSSWVGYFANRQALAPQIPKSDNLDWRGTESSARASLRYTSDVRLIFYWRRMSDRLSDPPLSIDNTTWATIVESISKRPSESKRTNPPMAMPIAFGPNLLHDLVPLIWSGGGAFIKDKKADLTSDAALSVPRMLMQAATETDGHDSRRRVVAFPEIPHEEAVQHFLNGEYVAIFEPVSFAKRWRDRIVQQGLPLTFSDQKSPPHPVRFWDYGGMVSPPRTFVGGSDLIVMNGARDKQRAFDLARFLATDPSYTDTLSELGDLPAQSPNFGIDKLVASLSDNSPAESQAEDSAKVMAATLDSVLKNRSEQEYPAIAEWPTNVESREVLESLQRIWRTIGGMGTPTTSLETCAAEAELRINQQIDRWTRWREGFRKWWPLTAVGLIVGLIGIIGAIYRMLLFRERALDEVRRVRGFTSSALMAAFVVHKNLKGNPYEHLEARGWGQAMKALILNYGLQGWRRGRDESVWGKAELKGVVWTSILLALETVHTACLFRQWENQNRLDPEQFLLEKRLLRSCANGDLGCAPFSFQVDCPAVEVTTPFMLEQALVCLLQNAIKASFDEKRGLYNPITVSYDPKSKRVSLANEAESLWVQNPNLCDALNENSSLLEFENKIHTLLAEGGETPKPGIGLVEAYCIATQCYGGLVVDKQRMKISIQLR
jgi:ABC-type glycerol-3-phosphate transport system substrate-binding protein